MLEVKNLPTNEDLDLRRVDKDQYGQKRIIVVSTNPDPKKASDETYHTKAILKQHGGIWDSANGYWYWNDRFKTEDQIFKLATDAVAAANKHLGFERDSETPEIKSFGDIELYEKIKEYLEDVKGAYEFIKNRSGKITKDIVDDYLDQLGDSLDNDKLLEDIASFNRAAKAYILETGKYPYSFGNVFLIWLQSRLIKGANEFGSQPYWYGRGYKPKENARKIFILKPGNTGSLAANVKKIITSHPNSPKEFAKEVGFVIQDMKNPIPPQKYNAFWNWANSKGYVEYQVTKVFNEVPIYDNTNVEPIPGMEQINAPEPPQWFSTDDTEDEKSSIMIEALKRFAEDNNITISQTDDLGGARGVSKGGHIQLLTNSAGVSLLATFIHEMAHELMHHEKNKRVADGKLYVGRQNSSDERELHAESVAYTVLKTYDFPIQHSINYLALWKQNKEKLKKYQNIIRDVSMFIIRQIEKYAPDVTKTPDELSESLTSIKNIIVDFKTTYNGTFTKTK